MKRQLYLAAGLTAVALGSIGIILPLLPTVPFMILAAFMFRAQFTATGSVAPRSQGLWSAYQELA